MQIASFWRLANRAISYSNNPGGLGSYGGWFSIFTQSELRLYRHDQDHRLLKRISWVIPVYLVISLVTPDMKSFSVFRWTLDSGGSKRSHETSHRREAARRGDEWNGWNEYLWRDIPGKLSLELLSWLLTYPWFKRGWLCNLKSGNLIPTYPWHASLDILSQLFLGYRNQYWDILGYPDLPTGREVVFSGIQPECNGN